MITRLFVALFVASATAMLAVVVIGQPDPPKAKPVMLTAAAPLVPRPVQTETYTRPAPAAAPVLAATVAAVELPKTVPPPAPVAHPPWAETPPIVEPKRERKRERRADAGSEDNVCTRHKLRKVWVSDRRWRCRR
jgi:hypothetical protein